MNINSDNPTKAILIGVDTGEYDCTQSLKDLE